MDIYRDYFNREELVRVLAQQPYTPGQLGALNIFTPVPLTSTTMAIEVEAKDAGKILTKIARGAPRTVTGLDKRSVKTFMTDSYGDEGSVMADEVLNARGAGVSGAKEIIENRRARLIQKLRRNADRHFEYLRMQALLNPATTEFGTAASGQVIAVQTDATKLRQEIFNKLILPIEAELDGLTFDGVTVLCSDGYWADLIEAKSVRETYLNTQQAAELRGSVPMEFTFGGVRWIRYRGTSDTKIPDNEARAIPTGVEDIAYMGYAPNDTMESVGSGAMGQPYYMGSKPLVDSQGTKGWEVSIQAHPKAVWARPKAVIPITKA